MSPRSNPKSLTVLCMDDTIFESEIIKKWIEKGHNVYDTAALPWASYDVIIGPRCWRIDPQLKLGQDSTVEESLERQLEMMEKGVRAIKYPKEKKAISDYLNPKDEANLVELMAKGMKDEPK